MKRVTAHYIAFDLSTWDMWIQTRVDSLDAWLAIWR